jgi:transglutaminase-like putative cysteine protease
VSPTLLLRRRPAPAWPAEHSVALRAAATGAVCVAVAACAAQGELATWYAAGCDALVCLGSVISYRRRTRPLPYLKIVLGAAMLAAFAWFFVTASKDAANGTLGAVDAPLAVLFSAMQAAHSFDMPSRRDLGFSLAGSATLIAVAAAQAIDLSFGLYVAAWALLALAALHASWASMAGGRGAHALGVIAASGAALLVAALLVSFLPAPSPPGLAAGPGLGTPGGAIGANQPVRFVPAPRSATEGPASASGPTGVGGFLGFAGPLDTALRPGLGNEVVLRVHANRPTYWIAETYDRWSGRSWTQAGTRLSAGPPSTSGGSGEAVLTGGPPFVVAPHVETPTEEHPGTTPPAAAISADVHSDYQTFYLAAPSSNLVLHADQATTVWIPTRRLYVGANGSIRTAQAMGAGSVYSVTSTVAMPSEAELENANGTAGLPAVVARQDLQLPHAYPRVAALARRVTAHDPTVLSKVHALERWISTHTRYTLRIPPLRQGQDTVVEFLFGTRRGFCEQISTSLAVMLRTLGIPAREAVGYVPGPFDPITGLYDEEAKDAHAWVQVWFPGYGWQSFDPTAYVPAANPSPASTIASDLYAALRRIPVTFGAAVTGALAAAALILARRRRRPRTWSTRVTRELERAARPAGLDPEPGATLVSIAAALDSVLQPATDPAARRAHPPRVPGPPARAARELATVAQRAAWGGDAAAPRAGRRHVRDARRIRRSARRHGRHVHLRARGERRTSGVTDASL